MLVRSRPSPSAVIATSAIAAGGMLAHDVYEFGLGFVFDPQTLIPLGIFVVLAVLAARETAGRAIWIALFSWAVLNLVGGGILSVLPLGLFPFQPEQSLAHYGIHVVYTLAEVPLVLVAWSGVRASQTRRGGPIAPEAADTGDRAAS
jgi:hypothetical protein